MATRFKRATAEDLRHVQPQIEALEQDKIRPRRGVLPKVISETDKGLVVSAKKVRIRVDIDPSVGYESKNRFYNLMWPLFAAIALWAQIKTVIWALLTFVRHVELEYESDSQEKNLPWYSRWSWKRKVLGDGTKVVVKWFNFRAAMRVWWCVPQAKRGEVLRPKYASMFYDQFSEIPRRCRYGAASWKALDLLYHHNFGADRSLEGRIGDFWMNLNNARAVRNRHRLITKELKDVILRLSKPEVKILSVACGSAEAVIQTVKELREEYGVTAHVTLLDLEDEALAYARSTAMKYGIDAHFKTIKENIRNLEEVTDGPYDVVEMLGFLDYQVFPKSVSLVSRIRSLLLPGGYFLTCNINPNLERYFVRWVISWPMIYRTTLDVAKIMVAGGFDPLKIEIIQEPTNIHTIAICNR